MVSRPPIAIAVFISLGFFHKSQTQCLVFGKATICNGKYKGLASSYAQKRFLALFYEFFCTYVSENAVKLIQKATIWSDNNETTCFCIISERNSVKQTVFQHIGAETQ